MSSDSALSQRSLKTNSDLFYLDFSHMQGQEHTSQQIPHTFPTQLMDQAVDPEGSCLRAKHKSRPSKKKRDAYHRRNNGSDDNSSNSSSNNSNSNNNISSDTTKVMNITSINATAATGVEKRCRTVYYLEERDTSNQLVVGMADGSEHVFTRSDSSVDDAVFGQDALIIRWLLGEPLAGLTRFDGYRGRTPTIAFRGLLEQQNPHGELELKVTYTGKGDFIYSRKSKTKMPREALAGCPSKPLRWLHGRRTYGSSVMEEPVPNRVAEWLEGRDLSPRPSLLAKAQDQSCISSSALNSTGDAHPVQRSLHTAAVPEVQNFHLTTQQRIINHQFANVRQILFSFSGMIGLVILGAAGFRTWIRALTFKK
eukprot:TRINITY_DN5831_c2_g1_i1.p1 TRINITY_DN5831_c2_g1~~TRINITY_DN5831_c2_g1_i1.p1  ORF type:complete len:367 (+),score=61.58 TRINITY_DN5831_c2_g1_i1:95-1195(+)